MRYSFKYLILFSLTVVSVFISCTESLMPEEFVVRLANDPSLNKKHENKQFRMSCSYRPAAFLAVTELQRTNGENINQEMLNKTLPQFDSALYFDFSIGLMNDENITTYNIRNQEEYTRMVSELTYNLGRDLYLIIEDKDTLRSLAYNYSNDYSMGRDARFLFVFPKSLAFQPGKKIDAVYNDRVFGIGEAVRFRFNTSDLINQLLKIKFTAS